MNNLYKIAGAGQGFDGLVVESSDSALPGYKQISKVIDTFNTGDVPPEMPVPEEVVLLKNEALEEIEAEFQSVEEENAEEKEEELQNLLTYGELSGIKTIAYDDMEAYLINYEKGIYCTVLHLTNNERNVVGSKWFPMFSNTEDEDQITMNAHAQVVLSVFRNVDSYEDLCKWAAGYILDMDELQKTFDIELDENSLETNMFENYWKIEDSEETEE